MRPIIALGELVVNFLRLGPFGLKALLFDVVVNPIELTDKSIKPLLLFSKGGLAGKDVRLTLGLIFFLLVGGLLPCHCRFVAALPRNRLFPALRQRRSWP